MKSVRLKKFDTGYSICAQSDLKILMLGKFLQEFRERDIAVFDTEDEVESYDGNESTARMSNGVVTLGVWYEDENPEYEFRLSKNTFIKVLRDWAEIKKQDPQSVTLYWEDGTYRFEIGEKHKR